MVSLTVTEQEYAKALPFVSSALDKKLCKHVYLQVIMLYLSIQICMTRSVVCGTEANLGRIVQEGFFGVP